MIEERSVTGGGLYTKATRVPYRLRVATRSGLFLLISVSLLLLIVGTGIALLLGSEAISPVRAITTLFSPDDSPVRVILLRIRLPRILLAIGVGGALASTGVLFQALLRNPLAEPYMLGISNGCAVGAILGYLLGAGTLLQPLMSFAGGAIVVFAVLVISAGSYGMKAESMLLSGVMIGAITAALIFLLLQLLGPQLRSAIQWMLGDLSTVPANVGYWAIAAFFLLLLLSLRVGNLLNVLAIGDEEAASLGVNVVLARRGAFLLGSMIIGIGVAYCGAIGFVGLVIPHIVRRLVGTDHRILLPLSVVGGGIFLILCDLLSRVMLPVAGAGAGELPIGAITALVGAPIFIYLLHRGAAQE